MLKPVADKDWPEELRDLKDGFMGQGNVWRTFAHHPALVRSLIDHRNHIVQDTALGPQLAEVLILRLAHRLNADYEWAHHVVRAREKGLADDRIRACRQEPGEMAEGDAEIARAVDALVEDGMLPPELARSLADRVGREGVLDLIATTGFYMTLGFVLKSFDTPIDRDIAERLERDPLD